MHLIPRAFVRQPSGRHLDLLDPRPDGWADEDLAIGLSRTYRWGGHSTWPLPLSVAQHSLTVLAIHGTLLKRPATRNEMLRELLHDADEALIGGFDPISPIKPILGAGYQQLAKRLEAVVFARYGVTPWSPTEHQLHKRADRLAAASEAVHVAGWSTGEVFDLLNIGLTPLATDPLVRSYDCTPWEPWAPAIAAERFFEALQRLQHAAG
jgi:hypothetical protein